jgi:threonine synthase
MKVRCPYVVLKRPLPPRTGDAVVEERERFDPSLIRKGDHSLWRYVRLLGLEWEKPSIRLGAGDTPLLSTVIGYREILVKLEYLAPTASFKDRGTAVMMNVLARQGVSRVVEDSSGNAGASVAAYAARAGIEAQVFVPCYASPSKRAQIEVYGVNMEAIPGSREDAKLAAIRFQDSN